MRRAAQRCGVPSNASLVAGRAERLPIASAVVDVVWLSTVVHHLSDLDGWAADVRRVLKPGGSLLIRNLFSDVGTTSWLPELPGADRARRVFPSVSRIAELVTPHGLELIGITEVAELHHDSTAAGSAATWIRAMRLADTLLLAFTDEEVDAGLDRLENYPKGKILGPVQLGLAAFRTVT